jgi:dephospho-CoA kinase
MLRVIALTGGIGSGKSTVSSILRSMGYCVYDADLFARDVLFYPEVQSKVKILFGDQVFGEPGILNRAYVRQQIFQNPALKIELESILHPAIANELKKKVDYFKSANSNQWIFYEAALILEKGNQKNYDACVLIKAEKEVKSIRLKSSRKMLQEDIDKIASSQMSDDEKSPLVDFVIDNSNDISALQNEIMSLIHFLSIKFKPSSF